MKQHKRGTSWSDLEVKELQGLVNKRLSWNDVAIELNIACTTARTAKACKNKAQALWERIHTNSVMVFTEEDKKKTAEFLRRTLSVRKPEGPSMCLWTADELALLSELTSKNMTWDKRAACFNAVMGTKRTGKALKERAAKMKALVGIAHVVKNAEFAEVCEFDSDYWYKALPEQEVQQQAMASTVCASSEACAEACDIDFQALLAVGVALPDTTWNPYQKPYN